MTKTVYICDSCKREVGWLYKMPRMIVEGNAVNFYNPERELCNECARKAIRSYNAVLWGNDKPKGRETL